MKEERYFVDRFTDKAYTISKYDGEQLINDIAVIHNYKSDNPFLSLKQPTSLTNLHKILSVVKDHQEDTEIFGPMMMEFNGAENESK